MERLDSRLGLFAAFLLMAGPATGLGGDAATTWPDGYVVQEKTTSPDGQWGVIVPGHELAETADVNDYENFLANIKSRQVLGKIGGADYFERQNHRDLEAVWAPDSSACVLKYDGRFGYETILLLEVTGTRFTQTDLGGHIAKALTRAAGDESYDSAWFRFGPGRRVRVRALGYTGNPKLEDEKTRHARFAGTYDPATKKWVVSEARRVNETDTLSDAYSVKKGTDIVIAPNGDQSKVPPDFVGMIVNSEEEKEQELDKEMNLVYKAVRMLLPPAKFAKVKDDQIAWLKKRDATAAGQKSGMIIERINALEAFLWN
jgi:uncharacterized protein YecT (DUF1311 family)